MSLPLVIDIALGTIFVYLILSLLASEVHELLATLLQWRADHLKRSIQLMLNGGGTIDTRRGPTSNLEHERVARSTDLLTDRLYAHPLINTLNHEATGRMAVLSRMLSGRLIGVGYKISEILYAVFGRFLVAKGSSPAQNPFARQASAPSYIPADTFAQTVMETFELSKIGRLVVLSRLSQFQQRKLEEVRRQVHKLALQTSQEQAGDRLRQIERDFAEILASFADGRAPLNIAIDRLDHTLAGFLTFCEEFIDPNDPAHPYFLHQIHYIHAKSFGEAEKQTLIAELKPDMEELLVLIRDKSELFLELQRTITDPDSQIYKSFSAVIQNLPELPDPLQNSLSAVAANVKQRADDFEEDLKSLQTEIETWFDKSMTRATGVYKRNARGVAILIGFIVAVATNADTLFIVDSLSNDSILRTTVSQYAITQVESSAGNLEAIKTDVRDSLDDVSLPLGWDASTLALQAENAWKAPLTGAPMPGVKRTVGWAISAIAISMGASFWYDLLQKVIGLKVGNSGGLDKSR